MSLAVSIGAETITVYADGEFYQVDSSHMNYPALLAELRKPERDRAAILELVEVPAFLAKVTAGRVQVGEHEVRFRDEPVAGYMVERMLAMAHDNVEIGSWAAFMDNLMDNPDGGVREDLYKWMETGKMPITEDGCLLGFKKVRADYTDVHTGKFSNAPGSMLEMDRDKCDPSRNNTCSTGFHFCSADYLSVFSGSKVVVVKINPRDVTAIPADYKNQKARCCRYTVLSELKSQSAAKHKVWSTTNVLDLTDPRELPDDLLVPRAGTAPKDIVPAPGSEQGAPPVDDLAPARAAAKPNAASPKKKPGAKSKAGSKAKAVLTKAVAAVTGGSAPDFRSAGKEFTAAEVRAAVAEAGGFAPAAKRLGVPATTLKGWARKLGLR